MNEMLQAALCLLQSCCFSEPCPEMRQPRSLWSLIPQIHLLILLWLFFSFWAEVKGGSLQSSLPGTHPRPRVLPIPQPCSFACLEISFFFFFNAGTSMAKIIRKEELGRVLLPSSQPHSISFSPAADSTGSYRWTVKSISVDLCRMMRQKNNRLDFPRPGFLSSPVLPGTSLPMPGALQNTF